MLRDGAERAAAQSSCSTTINDAINVRQCADHDLRARNERAGPDVS